MARDAPEPRRLPVRTRRRRRRGQRFGGRRRLFRGHRLLLRWFLALISPAGNHDRKNIRPLWHQQLGAFHFSSVPDPARLIGTSFVEDEAAKPPQCSLERVVTAAAKSRSVRVDVAVFAAPSSKAVLPETLASTPVFKLEAS